MGPRQFSRGNLVERAEPAPHKGEASMGPRQFSRGNMLTLSHTPLAGHRFNGAAAIQPRKFICSNNSCGIP